MGTEINKNLMKRTKLLLIFALILVLVLVAVFAVLNITEDGNVLIAENFVKNEATYKFDGIPETFRSTGNRSLECLFCREFSFEYQSRNSGYGDRKGMFLAAVITPHSAIVVVEKGTITSAVLDGVWDMKAQKMIKSSPPPEDAPDERVR